MNNFTKNGRIQFLAIATFLGIGTCSVTGDDLKAQDELSKDIIGTWKTPLEDTEMGPTKLEFTFSKIGVLMVKESDEKEESSDSRTLLFRYEIDGDQLVHVPHNVAPNQKIQISGNTLTLDDRGAKFRLVRQPNTESVARFIKQAIAELKSPDPEIHTRAVQALRYAGPEARAAEPYLIPLLKDHSIPVKHLALEAIANIGPPEKEVVSTLLNLLRDKDELAMGWLAATELGKFGPAAKDAVPTLIEMLESDIGITRWRAAEALGNIGPEAKAAIPILLELVRGEDT